MRALKTNLQMRRAEEVLLRVEARARRDYVRFQTDVDFVIRLRNVSDKVVTLMAPQPGSPSSPTAVILEIKRLDRDIYATELERSWSQTLFLNKPGDEPVRIRPGRFHEFPVRIPAAEVGPPISGLRVVEVGGHVRPTRLKKGDAWRTVRLRVRPGRAVVLPDGFEPLVDRPLASMRTAAETVSPIHLLLATEFVPSSRRPEAVAILADALAGGHASLHRAALGGLGVLREQAVGAPLRPFVRPLIEALERSPGRADAVMEGLSTVTGERFAPDPRFWRDWWHRESQDAVITARGDASVEPDAR